MADKRISMAKLQLQGPLRPEWLVHAPATAAEKIGVAEKYVFDLVNKGELERIILVDQHDREVGRGITYDSVAAYLKRKGKKRRQRTLPLPLPVES